ncbi:UNVERIFIED_CONTAM: hypothetical protein RMT77_002801 [Armadillidium vulgare]
MGSLVIARNLVIVVAVYALQFSNTSSSEINQSLQEDLNIAGDIIFRPGRKREIDRGEPWEGGIIPFVFIRGAFEAHEEALICDAMYHLYEVSNGCVEFVARTNETSFLLIRRHDVCAATVGQEKMFNTLRMNSECMDNFTILHELYHVLGFEHEQCRSDRDEYVTILNKNIRPDVLLNFDIIPDEDVLKVPYDYESIMHYPENAYSKNGNLTIITKNKKYQKIIGTKEVLSEKDILKIKKKYKCE